MRDILNKLDEFPRDFDKEAIWDNIEKPRRNISPVRYAVILALVGLLSVALWSLKTSKSTSSEEALANTVQKETLENNPIASQISGHDVSSSAETKNDLHHKTSVRQETTIFNVKRKKKKSTSVINNEEVRITELLEEIAKTPATENTQVDMKPEADIYFSDQKSIQELSSSGLRNDGIFTDQMSTEIFPLPILSTSLPSSVKEWKTGRRHRPHHLTLSAGVGYHINQIKTTDLAESMRLDDLEKPQLDFHVGIQYDYVTRSRWIMGGQWSYQLFKDRIATSEISIVDHQLTDVDYELFNHYHVMMGSILGGKRWIYRGFFADFMAGASVKAYQYVENDFFETGGLEQDRMRINDDYRFSYHISPLISLRAGTDIGKAWYVTFGLQANMNLRLTSPQAHYEHRMIPAQMSFGIGRRF